MNTLSGMVSLTTQKVLLLNTASSKQNKEGGEQNMGQYIVQSVDQAQGAAIGVEGHEAQVECLYTTTRD